MDARNEVRKNDAEKQGDLQLLRLVARQARPFAGLVLCVLAVDLLAAPLVLLAPLPLKVVVDSVIGGRPAPAPLAFLAGDSGGGLLVAMAFLLIGIAVLHQLQSLSSSILRTTIGERLTLSFRARLFRHAQRLSFAHHDKHGTSDPTYRIQHDAEALRSLVVDGALPLVSAVCTLASVLYVSFRIDVELALIALAVSPALFILSRFYRRNLRQRARQVRKLESEALSVVQEVLGLLRVVKAFGQEDREQARFQASYERSMRARLRVKWIESGLGLLLGLTTALGTAAVLVVGARNVQSGTLTLGSLLLLMGYLGQLYSPLKTLSGKMASVQAHLASAERAFALLAEPGDVAEKPDALPLRRARGTLTFEDVTFAYDGVHPVLRHVSLEIGAGTRVGLAGETGVGKTTLAALTMRFYDPSAGRIRLDGVDLRDLRLADLRDQFSLVPQEPVLFSTTIEHNIAYARPEASKAEIVAAARAANAHAFIEALPEGYATPVGERGMRLSGGERQRITLARAFLKDAPILVMDEPTSSLDSGTETGVLEAMERLMRGRTTLVIAHRPSTLEACDLVLTLRNGTLQTAIGARS
jgi:ATP-binding cassette, subfamily B, bacterial